MRRVFHKQRSSCLRVRDDLQIHKPGRRSRNKAMAELRLLSQLSTSCSVLCSASPNALRGPVHCWLLLPCLLHQPQEPQGGHAVHPSACHPSSGERAFGTDYVCTFTLDLSSTLDCEHPRGGECDWLISSPPRFVSHPDQKLSWCWTEAKDQAIHNILVGSPPVPKRFLVLKMRKRLGWDLLSCYG